MRHKNKYLGNNKFVKDGKNEIPYYLAYTLNSGIKARGGANSGINPLGCMWGNTVVKIGRNAIIKPQEIDRF